MNISSSFPRFSGPFLVLVAALLSSPAMDDRAQAYGGLWSSQSVPIRQSAEQIILVDNPGSTLTAIIQIEYVGPSQKFAWVIPVPGTPTVGVSSSTVFERLDAATAPQYWVEVAVHGACMQQDARDAALGAGSSSGSAPSAVDAAAAPVVAIDRGSVGPYDYVNLTIDPTLSDPAKAATDWLAMNGYDSTTLDSEALSPYLKDGLNLLAVRLTSGADAGAIRPIILTYQSELPMIPIRPTAEAAQDDMRMKVWVIGPSQAVPINYASLVINDALIDWLTAPKYVAGTLPTGGAGPFGQYTRAPSNYDAVVTTAANQAGGRGFVTELAAPASQFRERIWSSLDDQQLAMISSQSYADGIDAILAASNHYRAWDGFRDAVEAATTLPAGVTFDDLDRNPDRYRGVAEVDTTELFRLLEKDVVRPVADTAALFYNAPYLTRLYTTISANEMTVDPIFDYNSDLAQVSNVHIAKQLVQCNPTRNQSDAPWRIELPQGGAVVGEGDGAWPVAESSVPANLEVVMLSTSGSGTLLADNRENIGMTLWKNAGAGSGTATLHAPQNGVMIGGRQTVTVHGQAGSSAGFTSPSGSTHSGLKLRGGATCSVSRVGEGSARGPWLPLAAMILALCRRRSARAWAMLLLAGCSAGASPEGDAGARAQPVAMTRALLRDPEACKGCHPNHYREWSSSMHAYAAKDPVFLAMNRRGQRETHGQLGDFCIKCHAPMAVLDGSTKDGLDLERLPDKDRGVSCFFCHDVTSTEGDHNAMLHLADDTTMRGPIRDPLESGAHQAEYSDMFSDTSPKSSALCGGCHDIVTRSGVHLERTFAEYRDGIFSKSATGAPPAFDSCVGCHMRPQQGLAAVAAGAGQRPVHEHLWPGIDVPLTAFPHRDALRSAVEDCQLGPASISFFTLEVTPPDLFTFQLETQAGHNQPSGAAQDRRMWLELLAYGKDGELLDQVSSGNIADGEIEDRPEGDERRDPHLLMFRDRIYDAQGKPVHMFWQAAASKLYPDGYESNVLPVSTTTYIEGKHAVLKQYRASGPDGLPARVTARLRMRPIGLDVLKDLVDSGDLDPAVVAQMPTLTFGAQIEWTRENGLMKPVAANPKPDCSTYRCLLDPSSQDCK